MVERLLAAAADAEAVVEARHQASWRGLVSLEHSVRSSLAEGMMLVLDSFHALLLPIPASVQTGVAAAHAELLLEGEKRRAAERPPPRRHGPLLRTAVVRGSANSNVERLAALLALSPELFAPTLFSTRLDAASVAQLRASAPHVPHTSLARAGVGGAERALVRSRCDLLLDCSGWTAGHILPALARRPCAVATSVLGFAGSYGGGRLVDYLTVDRVAVPPSTSRSVHPSERLALLPHAYQVSPLPLPTPPRSALPPATLSLGTGRTPLIGSFTRPVRWHPSSFAMWASALRRSRATLLLLTDEASSRRAVRAEAAAAGLRASRVVFGGYVGVKPLHLSRHALLDATVDTTPYGSHTTGADAAGAGVPLLTLPADGWASRVGAS